MRDVEMLNDAPNVARVGLWSPRPLEWVNSSTQFVPPSSRHLAAGASASFEYRMLLAPSVRHKDDALAAAGVAVFRGVPGYVLGTDMADASLLVRPGPRSIRRVLRPRARACSLLAEASSRCACPSCAV